MIEAACVLHGGKDKPDDSEAERTVYPTLSTKERRNTLAFSEQVTEHLSLRGTWLFLGSVRMMRQQARVTRSPTSFHTADKQILGDAFAPASSGWAGWIDKVSLQLREAMSARCRTLM